MEDIIQKPLKSYSDERGIIEGIVEDVDFKSVLRITSLAGTIRANHFHKEDYHHCLLESGKMEYFERPVGSTDKPTKMLIKAGQVFYTRPMVEHAMKFTKDSVFWCYSKLSRKQKDYESDTVRLKFDLTKV